MDRSELKKKIDREHARYIVNRDGGRCVICRSPDQPECGHIFTRGAMSTRWDIEPDGNCHCQCHACNAKHEEDPAAYEAWYVDRFGEEAFMALLKRHREVKRYSMFELYNLLGVFHMLNEVT
jgi:5-methylcytosine-specific restriction endonuclease McrA